MNSFDDLLIGDDLVGARGQKAIDAADPERVFEGDRFPSSTNGHASLPFANSGMAALCSAPKSSMRPFTPITVAITNPRPDGSGLDNCWPCGALPLAIRSE